MTQKSLSTRVVNSFELYFNARNYDVPQIEKLVKSEPAILVGLLKYANTVEYGMANRVKSVRDALVLIGHQNFRRWLVGFDLFSNISASPALIQNTVVRGLFCEFVARHLEHESQICENAYLCGLFSLMDVAFEICLDSLLQTIHLEEAVKDALLGVSDNLYSVVLKLVIAHEQGDYETIASLSQGLEIASKDLNDLYFKAVVDANRIM